MLFGPDDVFSCSLCHSCGLRSNMYSLNVVCLLDLQFLDPEHKLSTSTTMITKRQFQEGPGPRQFQEEPSLS